MCLKSLNLRVAASFMFIMSISTLPTIVKVLL